MRCLSPRGLVKLDPGDELLGLKARLNIIISLKRIPECAIDSESSANIVRFGSGANDEPGGFLMGWIKRHQSSRGALANSILTFRIAQPRFKDHAEFRKDRMAARQHPLVIGWVNRFKHPGEAYRRDGSGPSIQTTPRLFGHPQWHSGYPREGLILKPDRLFIGHEPFKAIMAKTERSSLKV